MSNIVSYKDESYPLSKRKEILLEYIQQKEELLIKAMKLYETLFFYIYFIKFYFNIYTGN